MDFRSMDFTSSIIYASERARGIGRSLTAFRLIIREHLRRKPLPSVLLAGDPLSDAGHEHRYVARYLLPDAGAKLV
jgi:hypothetical protein